MNYLSELRFTEKLLQHMNLSIQYLSDPFEDVPFPEDELHRFIYSKEDLLIFSKNLPIYLKPNTIYRIQDQYFCNYLFFQLPETDLTTYACIGPYMLNDLTEQDYLAVLQNCGYPPEGLPALKKYFEDIPFFPDEHRILNIIYTLGEIMWGNADNFSLTDMHRFVFEDIEPEPLISQMEFRDIPDTLDAMKRLEDRYAQENQIIQAVSQGQTHKAEVSLDGFISRTLEKRTADPLRNQKNYMIILNTLLRKAAEAGAVHPLHIDDLSSRFARKIELSISTSALNRLQMEMIHKYCLLVKNHSLKGYSLLIGKVLTRIDSDLTADLSLRAQAELLNLNSSYLSTLFKKEVGMTLTDYVNNKRIEHAIFLLNTTTLQIQTIAQHCGIPDVNYFTKTFKKHIGKTPKEYRDMIMSYKKSHPHSKSDK